MNGEDGLQAFNIALASVGNTPGDSRRACQCLEAESEETHAWRAAAAASGRVTPLDA